MKTKYVNYKSADYNPADLVERIELVLSEQEEQDLVTWIDTRKSEMSHDRNQFLERHKKYLYNWDDFVTFIRKGPWTGSSQLHMPLTSIMVKTYMSRLYNIFTSEETTQFVPRETSDEEHVRMMRMLRKWYMWDYLNGYRGIRGFAREAFYDCVTVGFGIGMKDWETQARKIISIEENELAREIKDMQPQIEEAQSQSQMLETEEETASKAVDVKPYKEVQKVITVFEGTRLQTIPFESAYFPNFIPESSNLDFPPCVVIETEMKVSDVMLKGMRSVWDKKKCDAVRDMGDQQPTGSSAEVKQRRSRLSGVEDTNSRYKQNRVIEYAFCSYDIDGDGINEEIVVTKCRNVILKTTLLDRISPSGMRPLFKFDCFSKPRQAYSRGVPEFMYPLNEEMDQHHNMRIDYLALQTCPFGVYRSGSSLKNEPIQIAPGKFIPVDEITDMKVMNFNSSAMSLSSEEDRLWNYAERLASVSSLAQGVVPETVGPTRSTSGVVTLLKQMDKEFIVTVDQIADQWKKMEKMIIDDLDTRIDTGIKMRVLGATLENAIAAQKNPEAYRPALEINAQFDYSINVARIVTSDEVRRNESEMVLNKLAAPSILQQSGVVGPKALYKALCDWLKEYGKDESQYLDKPKFIQDALTLYQEIQICSQQMIPPMSMQDDHIQKAQMLIGFMKTPEYLEGKAKGILSRFTDEWIVKTAQKHMQLAQMMKPQGLPNPTGANGANQGQLQTATAPQQGGQNPEATTSREAPVKEEEASGTEP